MEPITGPLARYPRWALLLGGVLTLAALLLCVDPHTLRPRIAVDPSIERLLPPGDADREVFERARQVFGDADAILVAVRLAPVFSVENLRRVERISEALKALPGVSTVFSLASAPNLVAADDALEVRSFTRQAEFDPASIAAMPAQLAANPLYSGSLVSADGELTIFALGLSETDETAFRRARYDESIRALIQQESAGSDVWITGAPVVKAATTDAILRTLMFVLPAVFVLIVVVIQLAFRCVKATLVTTLTIALSLLWTLAALAALDFSLNLVTAIVPPLVITLALSYSVHVLSEYFTPPPVAHDKSLIGAVKRAVAGVLDLQPPVEAPYARLSRVLSNISLPLLLCGATTIAGFLALLLSPLPAIRQFAVLSSLGVVFAIVLMIGFLPAALNMVGCERRLPVGRQTRLNEWAARLASFDVKWRSWIIAFAVILIPLDAWFATQIRVGTDYIYSFDESAPVRQDFERINTAFNGANQISILIETYVNDALTDPALIREVDQLQAWLREQPEVGAAVSYVDYLKLINRGMNDGDDEFFSIPDNAPAVKQLLIFGGGEELKSLLDAGFRTALLTVRINVDGSIAIGDLVTRIEGRLAQLAPPLNAKVTGTPVIATRTVNAIASGQWQSIAIAVFAIWLMLSLLFTSASAGLLALLPNLVPIATYFGLLGLLDISLNPTTSLIACIVLGIAVDDTVHFLARFNADARATADEKTAIKSALAHTLRPVTLTTIALCLGFLVFTGSELKNQVEFGLLSAFTLFIAWVADITLTPALGSRLRIVTLWDLVRLDLGQSPQHTIPLLSGLTLRQARVFALLSKMEQVKPGMRLIQQGELARDVYVIVEGTLEVSIEKGGERKILSTMGRGGVIGEAGYFGQRRTASVDALTASRVLRFDSQDLERLRLRYPKIAAIIYRNLNRVQAERIARTTAMLQ